MSKWLSSDVDSHKLIKRQQTGPTSVISVKWQLIIDSIIDIN